MKTLISGLALSLVALFAFQPNAAQAQGWGGYGSYYGNGGHDFSPHWHSTYTPFSAFNWYGNGPHDYQPHQHVQTPYSYGGFSGSPWGMTRSYYPQQPYYFAPW